MHTVLTVLLGIALYSGALFLLLGGLYGFIRLREWLWPVVNCLTAGCERPSMPGLTVCRVCRSRPLEPLTDELESLRGDEYAPGNQPLH